MTDRTAHPARYPHAGHLSRSDRDETAARQVKGIPWGGIECQAQSERPKRDPRRSIKASKVAANLFGRMQPRQGQSDGAAPASKIAEAWGPTSANAGAGRPMPSAQTLTSQQLETDVSYTEKGHRMKAAQIRADEEQKVVALLEKRGAVTTQEILKELGFSRDTIRARIKCLVRSKTIRLLSQSRGGKPNVYALAKEKRSDRFNGLHGVSLAKPDWAKSPNRYEVTE